MWWPPPASTGPRAPSRTPRELLGRAGDARHFRLVAGRVRAAFNQHYVEENGTVQSDCATVYALAIVFGLLDELMTARAGDRLSALVKENGYRISTGFAWHAVRH